jgi:hypothetical protein
MGVITIFEFFFFFIINIVDYGLVTKSLGELGAHLRRWQEKTKLSKDKCEFLTTKLG